MHLRSMAPHLPLHTYGKLYRPVTISKDILCICLSCTISQGTTPHRTTANVANLFGPAGEIHTALVEHRILHVSK